MSRFHATSLCVISASVLLIVPCVGCGGGSSATVSGQVKLDGAPLKTGSITFTPVDGKTPSAGVVIENGAYEVELEPGPKQVKIVATKVVGQKPAYAGDPNSPMQDITEEVRFDEAAAKLTREIKSGENTENFDLTSTMP